ncbi:ATP-grasp domain-containing protein [Frigoriglobus tundricola]|uniref:ATP-grasp domain-containing protein n=1 Tax=Frigoriglobus tundricola TaxID=2774151 RepID=A0A6M5YUH7_9BACT|nr:ATP-grasp domain-containing protein [Frigoriglobus tundricola]QJW97747.1 hypothetical protein FTUN_5325 [Frigoriglobus tundricola]
MSILRRPGLGSNPAPRSAPPRQTGKAAGPANLSVFLIATAWVPIAARVGIRLVEHGCTVSAIGPRGHPLRHVTGIRVVHDFDPFDAPGSLAAALAAAAPTVVVPCDDAAAGLLHDVYHQRPDLRALIAASIGAPDMYPVTRSRIGFMKLARARGLSVPDTVHVRHPADIDEWPFAESGPAVMKRGGTSGGYGVQIVRSRSEALSAFRGFDTRPSPLVRWKRWVVNRDPLAFWPFESQRPPEIILQSYIPGRPANTMLACWRGAVLGSVTVEAVATQGETGASTIIRFITNREIADVSKRVAAELSLSGFHGLDFVIEEATGTPYLIELNPRCTQLGHLNLPGQGDLVGVLCRHLGAPAALRPDPPINEPVVAFFPQATAWTPDHPFYAQCRQDIPWQEPALVRELLRAPWPERRWVMRLYRRLFTHKPEPKPDLNKLNAADRRALSDLLARAGK